MIRTTLAAFALTALLASTSFAGECLSCGSGPAGPRVYGGYGAARHWDGYCGDNCGGCDTCHRCCFPILNHTLHKIGRVVDCLIPDPCCRPRGCGYRYPSPNCCEPACGVEGGYSVGPAMADPFMDDHIVPTKPVPTPMPMKDARMRTPRSSSPMARPIATPAKPMAKPSPMKTAAAPKAMGKSAGKSVLKVSYEDEVVTASVADVDAPPAAPVSIRKLMQEEQPARITAKPVIRQRSSIEMPSNPLR